MRFNLLGDANKLNVHLISDICRKKKRKPLIQWNVGNILRAHLVASKAFRNTNSCSSSFTDICCHRLLTGSCPKEFSFNVSQLCCFLPFVLAVFLRPCCKRNFVLMTVRFYSSMEEEWAIIHPTFHFKPLQSGMKGMGWNCWHLHFD